jgi:hypothetical protein
MYEYGGKVLLILLMVFVNNAGGGKDTIMEVLLPDRPI